MRHVFSLLFLALLLVASPQPLDADAGEDALTTRLQRLEALAEEQAAMARTLLESEDPKDVAWGAYTAGRRGLARVGDDLIAALKRVGREHSHARLAVLAALIDLEIAVDRALLLACVRERSFERVPAVILALQPYGDEGLLPIWDAIEANDPYLPDEALIAIGNRLAEEQTPGFAARLMGKLRAQVKLQVYEGKTAPYVRTPSGHVTGSGRLRFPAGYPPAVRFWLHQGIFHGNGRTLLAGGAIPIFVTRLIYSEREEGCSSISGAHWPRVRRGWLGTLIAKWGSTPAEAVRYPHAAVHSFRWSNATDYEVWTVEARDDVAVAYWALAYRLIQAEVLTHIEARALSWRADVKVLDRRTTTSPLPALIPFASPNPFRP